MDVFYYWKDWEKDLAAGRIGWLRSSRLKLGEFRERHPDKIYAFRQPPGRKGELRVVASLAWCDTPKIRPPGDLESRSIIFYDPTTSVRFDDSAEPLPITEVTRLVREWLPRAFASNFQGDSGLHAIDGDFRMRLRRIVSGLKGVPLVVSPSLAAS